MLGIDHEIACHKLAIDHSVNPIQQNKRQHNQEQSIATKVEVNKLLKMGFIEEALHTTWLANVVMVKKVNGS